MGGVLKVLVRMVTNKIVNHDRWRVSVEGFGIGGSVRWIAYSLDQHEKSYSLQSLISF